MSEAAPKENKPRKIYKKIYRKKGYNCDGSKRLELTKADRGRQIYNLRYGRICMAYKMEGLKPPDKVPYHYIQTINDPEKGKTYSFNEKRDGKDFTLHLRTRKEKGKTTNYYY